MLHEIFCIKTLLRFENKPTKSELNKAFENNLKTKNRTRACSSTVLHLKSTQSRGRTGTSEDIGV